MVIGQRQHDVVLDRAPGQQAGILEHITQARCVGAGRIGGDGALELAVQSRHQIQQGGFTAPRGAHQTDEFIRLDAQMQIFDDRPRRVRATPVALAANVESQAAHRRHRCARRSSGRSNSPSISCTTPMKAIE